MFGEKEHTPASAKKIKKLDFRVIEKTFFGEKK